MTTWLRRPEFHAVKTAGPLDTAGSALKFLGTAHPLPGYSQAHSFAAGGAPHGVMANGYGPGLARQVGMAKLRGTGMGAAVRQGLGETAKNVGHQVGEFARAETFGHPFAAQEALKSRGYLGMARDTFVPRLPKWQGGALNRLGQGLGFGVNTALQLGMPALQAYSAWSDPQHRGSGIGGTLAGLAAAPLTGHMGAAGALVQYPAMQAGRWLGSHLDKALAPKPAPDPAKTAGLVGLVRQNPLVATMIAGAGLEAGRRAFGGPGYQKIPLHSATAQLAALPFQLARGATASATPRYLPQAHAPVPPTGTAAPYPGAQHPRLPEPDAAPG